MVEFAGEIKALRTYSSRNRRMIWGLTASVVFDVLLSVALGIVAIQASNASSAASQNKRTLYVTCLSGNESRELQRNLWGFALNNSDLAQTAAERRKIEELRKYVKATFQPRDCARTR